jgi:hypothetical protein
MAILQVNYDDSLRDSDLLESDEKPIYEYEKMHGASFFFFKKRCRPCC